MSKNCRNLHILFNSVKKFNFPFNEKVIPLNGIYVLFEKDELAHSTNRIVRAGTHTGNNQLRSRLQQHFINENKDRSIFRKNIGRALLTKDKDPFLKIWELDLTTKKSKEEYSKKIDFEKLKSIILSNSSIVESGLDDWLEAAEIKFEKRRKHKNIGLVDCLVMGKQRQLNAFVLTGDAHFKDNQNTKLI